MSKFLKVITSSLNFFWPVYLFSFISNNVYSFCFHKILVVSFSITYKVYQSGWITNVPIICTLRCNIYMIKRASLIWYIYIVMFIYFIVIEIFIIIRNFPKYILIKTGKCLASKICSLSIPVGKNWNFNKTIHWTHFKNNRFLRVQIEYAL